jgi:O-antigen/teichoic acid export membrane protein
MIILALPIGVGTTILADRLIAVVFGSTYANSARPLQILVWSSVFIFVSIPFGNLFNSLNKQAIVAKAAGIGVVLNVILNLLLIPRYSLIGASIATVSTEFLILALFLFWSRRIGYTISLNRLLTTILKVSILSALMGIFIVQFPGLTLLALVPLGALLYFMGLFVIRGIDGDDVHLAKKIVRRRRTEG